MTTNMRYAASKRLLCGALALPMLLVACADAGGDGESVSQRDDQIVTENANDKIAFDYFVGKGLTDVQTAGIVGNLDQESSMDPTIWQIGGGPGRGIAQWSAGGRWDTSYHDNVKWYAAEHGASIYSLDLQLDFIWYELTEIGYGYSELRAEKTVDGAEGAFQDHYEICGTCDASNRIAHADAALSDFGGGSSPPPASYGSCNVEDVEGTCIAKSTCATKAGHVSTPGFCPGPADIECCTAPPTCKAKGVEGLCMETSVCSSLGGHHSTPGLCPGPANEECCTD
jgi:Phage tail lysozyme